MPPGGQGPAPQSNVHTSIMNENRRNRELKTAHTQAWVRSEKEGSCPADEEGRMPVRLAHLL